MTVNEERRTFDVDIDVKSDFNREDYGVRAMVFNHDMERINPHPSGVYLEPVPVDEATGLCAFDYKYGNDWGFMKVDVLSNSAYDKFSSKKDLLDCLEQEPNWDKLKDPEFVKTLPHIGKYHDLMLMLEPKSIEELADCLALIRPAKKKFIRQYKKNKRSVRRSLYLRPTDGTAYFKKSHAISYAVMIVALMNKRSDMFGISIN